MAERDFQRALLHVYRTIEPGGDFDFAAFDLSDYERAWLDELLARDRAALTMFGDQLAGKRRTILASALPITREAFVQALDTQVDRFLHTIRLEGAADPSALIRRFAVFLGEFEVSDAGEARALDFARFEACLAAVAAPPPTGDHARDPGLQLGRNAFILSIDYDVVAGFEEPARIHATPRLAEPAWLLLFADRAGNARALAIGAALAALLRSADNTGLERALATIEDEGDRARAWQSVTRLLEMGVPVPVERAHA